MKTKFNGILTLLLALVVQISFAQEKTVSGTVSDASGALPGVSVMIKGTKSGTETDFDGKYTIKVKTGEVLSFTYLGYTKVDKVVGTTDTINVLLQEDANVLDEVVVVAYGSQKRASITGSVKVIDAEQVENSTFSNPVKSLEGLVSGLRIIQADGQPGSDPIIRIRGFGSINASNSPLIVLDGIPYSGSLNSINPQDIESTTVLKDASSTSLYGNKASNGVLLITTKKGKKNRIEVSVDSRYGITQRGAKDYDVIQNPGEYYETYHSVLANSEYYRQTSAGNAYTMDQARQYASNNLISKLGYNLYNVPDADLVSPSGQLNSAAKLLVNDRWEDALFRDAATFNSVNGSVSGGSEEVTYYFSLGNENNNGYTVRSNFNRKTARLKAGSQKIANLFTLNGDVSYSKSNSQGVPGDGGSSYSNAFFWTRRIAPIYPVYQYDENWNPIEANNPSGRAYDFGQPQNFPGGIVRGPRNYALGEHPLAVIENSDQTNERDNFNAAFRAKFDLPFDIKFEYVMNYLTQTDKNISFRKPGAGAFAQSQNGLLTNGINTFSAFTNQQLLTWNKEVGRNSFDVILGHETYQQKGSTLSLTKYNIVGTLSPILDNASKYIGSSNYNTQYNTEGYFSRFIYGLDDTYYLNLTARYDASSVFSADTRWGAFWSAGASWIISNEDFMDDLSDTVNYAKLAVNYGTTGNDRILYPGGGRNYVAYQNQYDVNESNDNLTLQLLYLGNPDLTWERAGSFDIAYEMSLFNRVNLSLGYYSKTTNDLLFNTPLALSTGAPSKPENIGSMVNSGFETDIAWNVVRNDKVNININANLSTLQNEITKLPVGRDSIQAGNFRRVTGRSIFDYYMRKSAGVNPDNGNAQWYKKDPATGEDIITEEYAEADRYFLDKKAIPAITGGFGASIDVANWSLGLQFAYQLGGYGIDNEYYSLLGATQDITNFPDYNQTWTTDNTTASLPRLDPLMPNQYASSDQRLVDLSYLSLSNITLGYLLEDEALTKYNIKSLKFYGTINNAFLLYSARQGYDPRLNSVGASSAEYGANRTISFGVNVKL